MRGQTFLSGLKECLPSWDGQECLSSYNKKEHVMMDITRNQYFFAGLVFLLLGLEFNMVDTYTLTAEFTQFLADRTGHPMAAVGATTQTLFQTDSPPIQKNWRPPEWLGWSLISLGSVLILHSWAMKKPGT
jgi:hypothetical protein